VKIVTKKDSKNLVVIQVETLDDLWILYNLIAPGDRIDGKTSRRIVMTDKEDDTGERRLVHLKIVVESIEFHEFANRLRAKGKIIEGPDDIQLNSYHTFNIEENTVIGIQKDEWTQYYVDMLVEASKRKTARKLLVVAIDSGDATFGEIGDYYQKTSLSISEHIPGKRYGDVKDSDNARNAFFADCLKNLEVMAKQTKYSKIIITGPGFTREHFMEYCARKNPSLAPLLMTEASSSASMSGIRELLHKQTVTGIMKDSRILEETKLVDEFFTRLGRESKDVAYGREEVQSAAAAGAIQDLLVTDELMRTINMNQAEDLSELLKLVETNRGKITVISTLHDAGRRIKGMGGIAALLRFKLSYA